VSLGRVRNDDDLGKTTTKGTHVGALVTLELPDDSPVLSLPWIITFGPLGDDEEWEPVVCGPYERAHAMALAETVVADEELMAVVEPVMPHTSVEEIRNEIATAKQAVEADEGEYDPSDESMDSHGVAVAVDDEYDADQDGEYADDYDELDDLEEIEPSPPPSPDEVRAGFARIAARLTAAR
jgi:hypothetical protein